MEDTPGGVSVATRGGCSPPRLGHCGGDEDSFLWMVKAWRAARQMEGAGARMRGWIPRCVLMDGRGGGEVSVEWSTEGGLQKGRMDGCTRVEW